MTFIQLLLASVECFKFFEPLDHLLLSRNLRYLGIIWIYIRWWFYYCTNWKGFRLRRIIWFRYYFDLFLKIQNIDYFYVFWCHLFLLYYEFIVRKLFGFYVYSLYLNARLYMIKYFFCSRISRNLNLSIGFITINSVLADKIVIAWYLQLFLWILLRLQWSIRYWQQRLPISFKLDRTTLILRLLLRWVLQEIYVI